MTDSRLPSTWLPRLSRARLLVASGLAMLLVQCTSAREEPVYNHGPSQTPVETKQTVVKAPAADAKQPAADCTEPNCETNCNGPDCTTPGETPDAKAPDAAPTNSRFKKGVAAPKDLSPKEVAEYNIAQGDPSGAGFTLKDAFAGDEALADPSNGALQAVIHTTMGDIRCDLYEDKVPGTIANFVGLSRGTRPWYDKMEDKWITDQPYYKDVPFHRVIKDFMVQTGDRSGTGRGGPGYIIVDEFDKTLRHTGPGILSMANRGPNTGSSQFFITVKKTPHLDKKHAVFGKCKDPKVAVELSEVRVQGSRPIEKVVIKSVSIERVK
ncbi:MAG: peptidylprolyl isomerase [Myxococcales bacterium]|nr:peptidylprolyl isomerase [Myxococcales bacterium]